MQREELRNLYTGITRTVAEAIEDGQTHAYVISCYKRFMRGDYGEIGQEDTEANNADLAAGEGHVLARYKAQEKLTNDIYIEAHFSQEVPGIDANNLMIMYTWER